MKIATRVVANPVSRRQSVALADSEETDSSASVDGVVRFPPVTARSKNA